MRTLALTLAKLAVSAALVWLLLANVDTGALLERLKGIHPAALAASVAILLAHTALCAWRWRRVCAALGIGAPAGRDALRWT
ncbi:MAG TPA: lysylphosphatidylglycerol synthase domain-containing protein, partial [Burkholderiales bacterium]|nr:lysylphosphatidylglycerol synthase domain-containing protein [Burkholderiales bacterium]